MTVLGESQTLRPAVLNDRFQQDRAFAPNAVIDRVDPKRTLSAAASPGANSARPVKRHSSLKRTRTSISISAEIDTTAIRHLPNPLTVFSYNGGNCIWEARAKARIPTIFG